MKAILTAILVLLLTLPLAAQLSLPKPALSPYAAQGNSLLDVARLSMRHSMGFSAGYSGQGGYYLSRYTNHLQYAFSPQLELDLDLNLINYGTAGSGFQLNSDNKSRVTPEFKLSYRPSDKTLIQVESRQNALWGFDPRPWNERW